MAVASRIDSRNANTLWASVLVETLAACGVTHAVVSPGSRSTPLAIALATHTGIEAIPVLDERAAGFFALGLARPSLAPVAVVCTSGTAAANLFPAVIEAHESGVPLLVITADRPPELRGCASGQTIDQQKLYGDYVNFHHELAVPEAREAQLRYLRQMVAHAVTRTVLPACGPVHLNAPFRDPLPPVNDGGMALKVADAIDWTLFFFHLAAPEAPSLSAPGPRFMPDVHGAIVVGPSQPAQVDEFVGAVGEIARRLGWPVLAEGLSPVRGHSQRVPHVVTTYDAILRHAGAAERLKPEVILCVGGWPTSKVLRAWIETSDAAVWLVTARPDNRDALHARTRHLPISLPQLARSLPQTDEENAYQRMWARYEEKARAALDARLEAMPDMFEGKAAWLLARHLPAETPLTIANSMPIRDVEYLWPANDRAVRPFCNRGANGIDGTLSTALGVAHAIGKPAVLLTGDLALLHDTNGFLLRPKLRGSLTVVLINNRGGGIFEHLPVAQFDPPFEDFFATPQEADFAKLCAAYGVEHVLLRDVGQFIELIAALPPAGLRVIEIRTDRKRDAAMRRQLFADVAAALG